MGTKRTMTKEEIDDLLLEAGEASLATIGGCGTPYVIPVNFVYYDGSLFIHGMPIGQKIDNIMLNPAVGMTVYEASGIVLNSAEDPCKVNTLYKSVVIKGTATLAEDLALKKRVLTEIVKKYAPRLADKPLPENRVKGTAVIEIKIKELTSKTYET